MNAHDLSREASDDSEGDQEELKSGVRATRELARALGVDCDPPEWSEHPPQAALPHDPRAFDRPPPLPDHEEVLRLVAEEALGSGLCRKMF